MKPYACFCLIQYSAAWCHIRLTLSDWPCSFWTLCENRDFVSLVILASHYYDILMGAMASQITSFTSVYSIVYCGTDQRKTSKLRVTGLCERNSPVTFPAQRASHAQNDSIWWRHHEGSISNFFGHMMCGYSMESSPCSAVGLVDQYSIIVVNILDGIDFVRRKYIHCLLLIHIWRVSAESLQTYLHISSPKHRNVHPLMFGFVHGAINDTDTSI